MSAAIGHETAARGVTPRSSACCATRPPKEKSAPTTPNKLQAAVRGSSSRKANGCIRMFRLWWTKRCLMKLWQAWMPKSFPGNASRKLPSIFLGAIPFAPAVTDGKKCMCSRGRPNTAAQPARTRLARTHWRPSLPLNFKALCSAAKKSASMKKQGSKNLPHSPSRSKPMPTCTKRWKASCLHSLNSMKPKPSTQGASKPAMSHWGHS